MREKFKSVVERNSQDNLYIVIDRTQTLYGSLMRAWLEVTDKKYKVIPHDLTTKIVVELPQEMIADLKITEGQELSGVIVSKEYQQLKIPNDVAKALEGAAVSMAYLSLPQRRQGLLFISETENANIRAQRISTFVKACQHASATAIMSEP